MFEMDFGAAIFDLDGTLLDSMGVWRSVDVRFLARRGIAFEEDYGREMAALYYDLAAKYTIERYSLSETPEAVKAEWDELARDAYINDVKLLPGAAEYLRELRSRGIKLAYATSNNDYLAVPALEAHGIRDLFDACAYTWETGRDKQFPDVYLLAAERLGVQTSECVVFEDVPRCVHGAKSGGFRVVAVSNGSVPDEFSEADIVIEDFRCLIGGNGDAQCF